MFAISAINESETSRSRSENLAPTKEAQESHLTKLYQDALSSLQMGDLANARALFLAIIQDPLSIKSQRGKSDAMLHLRFLSYRNLADASVKQGPEFFAEGLQYYLQAVGIDDKDVVLWNRLGTLSCSLGKLNTARKAFERGLQCSPRHWGCMEKLIEVLIAIGDEAGCLSVVKRLLKFHPSHPRALHIKKVIEAKDHGIGGLTGMDALEPTHINLSFQRKRKLDVVPDPPKKKKRKQHFVQLTLREPSWLLLIKATLESLQNRQHGKVSKGEELKEKNGCFLANSRVIFSMQGLDGESGGEIHSKPADLTLPDNGVCDTVSLAEKISPVKLSEAEDSHAQERRSTRLERMRSRSKGEEAVADCPKSLTQLLEPFIIDSSRLEVDVELLKDPDTSQGERVDGCLIYSTSSSESLSSGTLESREVTQFMQDFTSNSGLYHVGHGILERVSSSGMDWKDHSELLLELEKYTRHWGNGRSSRCKLFLAELYLDAAASSPDMGKYLDHCNYNICRIVEWSATEARCDLDSVTSSSVGKEAGWVFWARFHWVYGCYCMLAGNPKKGFNEFRKCLSLLQEQRERCTSIVLPHCKMDNKISLEMAEQKLYEFEVGDLLKYTASKLEEEGKFLELIEVLEPALFSDRATKSFTGKCTEAVQSHEFGALGMLIAACQRVKPANFATQLKCHHKRLEIFCHCAGVFLKEDDLLLSPGSASSTELDDDRATWNRKLAEEVKLLSQCAVALKKADDSSRFLELPLGRIQNVLLAVLVHFGSGLMSRRHSNDNLQTSFFVDAAIAFCRVQQLHPGLSVEKQVALLVTVHELLAERGLCATGASCDDSFLKMAIKHLLYLEKSKQQTAEPDTSRIQESARTTGFARSESLTDLSEKKMLESEELEKRKSDGLDKALDQCFFCLYGLNLKLDLESGASSDLATHRTANAGDFHSKEQCAAVLQYVLPYAKACSKTGLVKLRKVLQAVRKQFPQPPSNVLAGNAIDAFLDDLSFDEEKLSEMVINKTSINELLSYAFPKQEENPATAVVIYSTPPEQQEHQTDTESYTEVYQNLYYLLSQVEETSPSDKSAGFVLTKEGEEFFEHGASLYKYDLLYNMLRFESWQKLAGIYDEEVDLLLNDGSKNVNVLEWRKNGRFMSRVESSRRRSRRCLLMSLALATEPKHEFQIHELLALVYYDTLQNTVPAYDQRAHVQKKDALWTSRCLNAVKHFQLAYSLRPDWTHLLYLGKLFEKLEKPSEESFSYYKSAIDLNPSAVDSLYRLHRSRLKLLCKGRYHDIQIIEVVSKFCFASSTQEIVTSKLKRPDEPIADEVYQNEIAAAWRALFKDCISAMQACIDGELKHFHKARFCIAQGLYCRAEDQDWERAKEELAFCFRSSRSLFTINMWELDGVIKKNKRKTTSHPYAKKSLELGLPESSRKFITCVRKYLLLYFVLCEKAGDYVTLERAYSTLRVDKRFSICLEDIASAALASYVHALGAAITQAENTSFSSLSSSSSTLQGLLERMFNLFMDYGVSWSEAFESGASEGHQEVADKTVYCYIHRYLHYLENDCRVDALELVNERIRKRFKHPKVSNPHFSQICRHATLAWCRALCSALSSVTPLERPPDHIPQLIVDLQCDVLLFSPYDTDIMSKISRVCPAATIDENSPPASAAYISRIKAIPIVQVSPENAEKAHSYLRATFVFYREVTSGPFPSGINLFMASPMGAATFTEPATGIQTVPGFDPLDLSTPRKLLLWAFALVHGRAASIADVVKYCEEQAKTRLKKWPTAVAAAAATATHVPSPEKIVKSGEQLPETDTAPQEYNFNI